MVGCGRSGRGALANKPPGGHGTLLRCIARPPDAPRPGGLRGGATSSATRTHHGDRCGRADPMGWIRHRHHHLTFPTTSIHNNTTTTTTGQDLAARPEGADGVGQRVGRGPGGLPPRGEGHDRAQAGGAARLQLGRRQCPGMCVRACVFVSTWLRAIYRARSVVCGPIVSVSIRVWCLEMSDGSIDRTVFPPACRPYIPAHPHFNPTTPHNARGRTTPRCWTSRGRCTRGGTTGWWPRPCTRTSPSSPTCTSRCVRLRLALRVGLVWLRRCAVCGGESIDSSTDRRPTKNPFQQPPNSIRRSTRARRGTTSACRTRGRRP